MKEPVDHIERPLLPWRNASSVTECGLDAAKVPTITREAFLQRNREFGQQRAALFTCMTCSNTAGQWGTWDDDPRQALQREVTWEGSGRWARAERGQMLKDELTAIAALVAAHRAEFDTLVQTTQQRREWLVKKAAMAQRPKPAPVRSL